MHAVALIAAPDQACFEAATWPSHIRIAVNVSPVQIRSATLALKVAAALAESKLVPGRLELEVTETVLIRDDVEALIILGQLRRLGVRIALDDFGTGYSSLSYLHRFPFDKIKIDRSFVHDIGEPEDSSPIVQAVVAMATARKMVTTAEGVETEEQRNKLRQLGCSQMQGYLIQSCASAPTSTVMANRDLPEIAPRPEALTIGDRLPVTYIKLVEQPATEPKVAPPTTGACNRAQPASVVFADAACARPIYEPHNS